MRGPRVFMGAVQPSVSDIVITWIIGGFAGLFLGLLGLLANWMRGHELNCAKRRQEDDARWAKLMEEHGGIKADVARILKIEEKRCD